MSISKLLKLTLLSITLTMVIGYSFLLEANLVSGLLFGAEIRLNRTADAWIQSHPRTRDTTQPAVDNNDDPGAMPPIDGTPITHTQRASLPLAIQEHLPQTLEDGQLTVIETDDIGFLNTGYLLHLFRTLPDGNALHVIQTLALASHETERVHSFDALVDKRALIPGVLFILISLAIVLFFGRSVSRSTTRLLHWCESLSIHALPDKPLSLPFLELQRIASGTLGTVTRERDAIDQQHRFLRFASHELRTPLAVASANTELLARYGVDARGRDAFSRLEDAIKTMNSLTDALLWLGRGETPLPDPEPVDLRLLADEIVAQYAAQADVNNVAVRIIADCQVQAIQPRVLLTILCSNLIGNAIRYTRNGQVDIYLSEAAIEITNQGELLGDKAGSGGHGLGLQLVSWVVERAQWQWDESGDENSRVHRVRFSDTHGR